MQCEDVPARFWRCRHAPFVGTFAVYCRLLALLPALRAGEFRLAETRIKSISKRTRSTPRSASGATSAGSTSRRLSIRRPAFAMPVSGSTSPTGLWSRAAIKPTATGSSLNWCTSSTIPITARVPNVRSKVRKSAPKPRKCTLSSSGEPISWRSGRRSSIGQPLLEGEPDPRGRNGSCFRKGSGTSSRWIGLTPSIPATRCFSESICRAISAISRGTASAKFTSATRLASNRPSFLRTLPDEKFTYRREENKIPQRFIRAYKLRNPESGRKAPGWRE